MDILIFVYISLDLLINITYSFTYLLTYLLAYILHGAKSFWRS